MHAPVRNLDYAPMRTAQFAERGPLIEAELPRRRRVDTAGNDPKPTSDALRRSMHEANGALPVSSGARLCTHRDPGLQSARDFSLASSIFSWRARCRSTGSSIL